MKTPQTLLLAATLSAGLLVATGASAALVASADGKTVWDADVSGGITWLSNANLAATETFGLARNVDLGGIPGVNTYGGSYIYNDGRMTWGGAMKWIAAMNAANYLGYHDWRLPTKDNCYQGDTLCSGSEMGHLYYIEFGNTYLGYYSGPGAGLVDDPTNPNDESLFANLQSGIYWYGTEWAQDTNLALNLNMYSGYQDDVHKNFHFYALAVRPGQVVATPVPAAAWLLGSGLLGLVGVARRKVA